MRYGDEERASEFRHGVQQARAPVIGFLRKQVVRTPIRALGHGVPLTMQVRSAPVIGVAIAQLQEAVRLVVVVLTLDVLAAISLVDL